MLKNIDPLLSPELLKILAEMGHEDAIVIADAYFTSMRFRSGTTSQQVIRLPGIDLVRVASAVLSVLPLGIVEEKPVSYMHFTGKPIAYTTTVQQAVINLIKADGGTRNLVPQPVERFAFYELAKQAYAIVQTGEMSPYGNFIFKKGVIN